MLLFAALALANELPALSPDEDRNDLGFSGTAVLPDARHRDQGGAEVTAGAGVFGVEFVDYCLNKPGGCQGTGFAASTAGTVRVAWTPAADLRVESNLVGTDAGEFAGDVTLSWSAPVSEKVRLGAFGAVYGAFEPSETSLEGGVALGASLSAQWRKVGFDLAVPLVVALPGAPSFVGVVATEAHVTFALGRGHSLSVGTVSILPGVGWQYQGSRVLARVNVHSVGVVTVGRVEVGAKF